MGWLNSEKPPNKWSAAYFKMFVEKLRTAINYIDTNNFPNGLHGTVINDKSVGLNKLNGLEFNHTLVALAEPYSTTSTSPTNVGGYYSFDTVWRDKVEFKLEITGSISSASGEATFELHGVDGVLATVVTTDGGMEVLRSEAFDPPSESQTFVLKMKTSNASYTAYLLSAKLIILLK